MAEKKVGMIVILSSPSGAGKTTLVKKLSSRNNFKNSISHTTRKPRINEKNGKDYFFVKKKEFKNLIKKRKFLEHAEVFKNYYGSLKETVIRNLEKGENVIFDIDWQGTKQLSKHKNLNLLKIFLITENKDELIKRLVKRNQNSREEIDLRFKSFTEDIKHWNDYDYIIINKNLDNCFKQIEEIIKSNKKINFSQITQ